MAHWFWELHASNCVTNADSQQNGNEPGHQPRSLAPKQRGAVTRCHRASQSRAKHTGANAVRCDSGQGPGRSLQRHGVPCKPVSLSPSTLAGSLVRGSMVPFPSNPPCSPWLSRPPKSSPTFIKCRCLTRPDLSLFPIQAIFISASGSFHSLSTLFFILNMRCNA